MSKPKTDPTKDAAKQEETVAITRGEFPELNTEEFPLLSVPALVIDPTTSILQQASVGALKPDTPEAFETLKSLVNDMPRNSQAMGELRELLSKNHTDVPQTGPVGATPVAPQACDQPGVIRRKLSPRDSSLHAKIGERSFRTLTNSEIRKEFKDTFQQKEFRSSSKPNAVKLSLDRIRVAHGYPRSKEIKKKRHGPGLSNGQNGQ